MLRERTLLVELANVCVSESQGGESLQAIDKIDGMKKGECGDLIAAIEKHFALQRGFTHILVYSLNWNIPPQCK